MSKSFGEFMDDIVDALCTVGLATALILVYVGFFALLEFGLAFAYFGYYLWGLLCILGWVASFVALMFICKDNGCPFQT